MGTQLQMHFIQYRGSLQARHLICSSKERLLVAYYALFFGLTAPKVDFWCTIVDLGVPISDQLLSASFPSST